MKLRAASFEQWISHLFDYPEDPIEMHARSDGDYFIEENSFKAIFLTATFSRAGELHPRFTDRQIEGGLWFALSEGYAASAMEETVPLKRRLELVRSTRHLFERLFAIRCLDLDFGGNEPLYCVCYMFWELFPRGKGASEEEQALLLQERFAVLESILAIDNAMCQYSALHGLGHLHFKDAARVERVVDEYLAPHPERRFILREYASDARKGNVQ